MKRRRVLLVFAPVVILVAAAGLLAARGILGRHAATPAVQVEPVERRTIAVTIEATGTVEPVDLVEVKSKASGQILQMPVVAGSKVGAGDLLAQIDTVDVQNQYEQALAAMKAAQAKADVSMSQKQRSDVLYEQKIITTVEHESALLDYATSEAALVKARTDLDTARQRRADATVRAPVAGTILEQLVSTGQVISSATSSVSGGTSLLKMADLSRIRLRAYVSETDIGSVQPGQEAAVSFEAYPTRTFQGTVEKIEPQAVVQQSVTMFPVLVSIGNEDGSLLPGMNGDVTMTVDRREDVPAVSVDAVRTMRDLPGIAAALGLNADEVAGTLRSTTRARVEDGRAAAGSAAGNGAGRDSTGRARRRRWEGAQSGASGAVSGAGMASGSRAQPQFAFVKTDHGLEPRMVRLGLSDFDYAQVLDGLKEGEEVVLLSVAELQAKRASDQNQMKQRMGNGLLGSSSGNRRSSGGAAGARSGSGAAGGGSTAGSATSRGTDGAAGGATSGGATRTSGGGGGGGETPPPPPGGF